MARGVSARDSEGGLRPTERLGPRARSRRSRRRDRGLNERALATLEFTTVRGMLAERTGFAPGHELAMTLEPSTTLADAERLQDETEAARQLLRDVPSAG